ncbi:MAG: hypothetical protein ACREP9_00555, partial [Candidatus Dormibacteraceae bacterium]
MLDHVIAVIGPPAAGKTALTSQLDQRPGHGVFRLQEHLPEASPAAAAQAEAYEEIDDFTVIASAHTYIDSIVREGRVQILLLDGFPGTGTQVSLFLSLLGQLAPCCVVAAVELVADPVVLAGRGGLLPNYEVRRRRYNEFAEGIRRAFTAAGIALTRLDTSRSLDESITCMA